MANAENPRAVPGANGIAVGELRAFIERVERLEEEKRAIADDIKEIYSEARGTGYDAKAMRAIVAMRRKDREKLQEERALIDLYGDALGIFG